MKLTESIDPPLPTSFIITSMPIGGAETLLVNLLQNVDRAKIDPEILCLKELGPLGEKIKDQIPTTCGFLKSKFDLRVVSKLASHFRRRQTQAVVTVGAGDKMFWGRIAARLAGVPVIASAIHSTGWPDGIGRFNRWLTPITDAFIAVAQAHGKFLIDEEGFPSNKVTVIANGIDTQRFCRSIAGRSRIRQELSIDPDALVIGIVAALRPEKNHRMFVEAADRLLRKIPNCHFLIVGDGPCRQEIEADLSSRQISHRFHLVGSRHDTPDLLSAMDAFALTSHNEASPVSILEAMATNLPVVATDVGSIHDTVHQGIHGFRVPANDALAMVERWNWLFENPDEARKMGEQARRWVIANASLESMVTGYENLLIRIWESKRGPFHWGRIRNSSETESLPLLATNA